MRMRTITIIAIADMYPVLLAGGEVWWCVCVCVYTVVQSQVMSDCLWPHGLQHTRLLLTISWSLFKLMSIELVMPANHRILCHPLLLLPSIFPSIKVFSIKSALRIRWPKYWSFSLSISPPKEYWGLISFRIDWFDLFAVQVTLKRLLQHHSLKTSIIWSLALFKARHHSFQWIFRVDCL